MKVEYFKTKPVFSSKKVGIVICPECKKRVLVVNRSGLDGTRDCDFLKEHGPARKECTASLEFVLNLY